MATDLKVLAFDINDLLSEYIIVHDTLIKKSNSIFSIFTPINFNELASRSKIILEKLKEKRETIKLAKDDSKNEQERLFASCLLDYSDALITTVGLLYKMLLDLNEKSKGEKLSLKEHLDNNKRYKESIKNYAVYGEKLNQLYKQLGSS